MMQILGLFILVLALFTSGASSATFTFKNKCHHTVWPATLTGGGSTPLSSTGFRLKPEATFTLSVASTWSGRFWGRTGCSQTNGKFQCATGDCASGQISCSGSGAIPPATLAEFSLGGYGGQDFYDVSLVDGFNLPLSITPQGGAAGCQSVGCPTNINAVCPPELSVKSTRSRNIACRSACDALKDPRYCCSGAYGTPTTCPPTPFSQIFKKACPQAYSYAYDDKTSTFTCTRGPNYLITFCP